MTGLTLGCVTALLAGWLGVWLDAGVDAPGLPGALPSLQAPSSFADRPSAQALLAEGLRVYDQGDFDKARQGFERALAAALAEKDARTEAGARRGLGLVHYRARQYGASRTELEKALALYDRLGDTQGVARVEKALGNLAYESSTFAEARDYYRKALALFDQIGDRHEKAALLYNLTFVAGVPAEREPLLREGLELARESGDRQLEGNLLQTWGESDFAAGDLSAAMDKIKKAISCMEAAGAPARGSLARALTSLGRVYRAHGFPDRSLELYGRALAIQQDIGDRPGVIQSLNALGVTCGLMGRRREGLDHLDRALFLAKQFGSPRIIDFQLGNLAEALIDAGQYARGAALLEDWTRDNTADANQEYRYASLATAYLRLGRNQLALAAAEQAVQRAKAKNNLEVLPFPLRRRAEIRQKMGLTAEALADARESLQAINQLRAHLVPNDFLKQGFVDQHQAAFTLTIDLLQQLGRVKEALETAEQARARAFIDLLASREVPPKSADGPVVAELRRLERAAGAGSGESPREREVSLTLRGGDAPSALPESAAGRADPEVRSLVTAPALSTDQLASVAARLRSTIVSFWVAPEATFVWVVRADGTVDVRRIEVSARRLTELVQATGPPLHDRQRRGSPDSQEDDLSAPLGAWEATEALDAPRVRGADLLSMGSAASEAYRELYRLLIDPVRPLLPRASGSLLTIVPHGPLFLLSFAALMDGRGRYLLEDYAVHYAPAGAVLQFTEKKKARAAQREPHYLLVADPGELPALPTGKRLAPLPGSRREVDAIAGLLPAGQTTVLTGTDAHEEAVRRLAGVQTVLHFATHAVVRDDLPLDSFLALGVTKGGTPDAGGTAGRDGRLTAMEIYSLDLNADLVVLSACRTGLGKLSGEGIVGLVRGFLYAGTPSVVATLWDLADEPAALLLPEFYRSLSRTLDKSAALRTAQLRLLSALRRGQVKVPTAAGLVTLPEHPAIWASFVLMGER